MAAKRSASGKSSKAYVIDFSKDTSEGGRKRYPEADYRVKLVGHKTGESKDKGTPFVQLNMEMVEGKYKGEKISDRLYITDNSLWRIRSALEAMGVTVPRKRMSIKWADHYGKELGVTITDDEYEGRVRSRVSDFIDLDTLAGTDVDDEDEDEDDEEESDDLDDMDRAELKAYIKENKLEVRVGKKMSDEDLVAAIREAEGDEEEEDEDLEEFDADEDL